MTVRIQNDTNDHKILMLTDKEIKSISGGHNKTLDETNNSLYTSAIMETVIGGVLTTVGLIMTSITIYHIFFIAHYVHTHFTAKSRAIASIGVGTPLLIQDNSQASAGARVYPRVPVTASRFGHPRLYI